MRGSRLLPRRVAGALFFLDLIGILIFGLWPFGHPRNEVTWVPNRDSVRLGKRATLLSSGALPSSSSCTFEFLFRPSITDDSSTLLAFYGPRESVGVSVHQSLGDLRLDNETGSIIRSSRFVNHVFEAGNTKFLAIVLESEGISVYVDGSLAQRLSGFASAQPCGGSFVLGDSPRDNDTWQGEISGLAIYQEAVSGGQIAADYKFWTGGPTRSESPRPNSLYLFNERSGRIVRDHGLAAIDLQIPERYVIVRQVMLESPLRAFEPEWGYVEDLIINIGGFVPFGATLYAYLLACGWKRYPGTAALLGGVLTSLAIESLQAYLPTRDSDLTDVLTNTVGTWLGVYLLSRAIRLWRCGKLGPARPPAAQ